MKTLFYRTSKLFEKVIAVIMAVVLFSGSVYIYYLVGKCLMTADDSFAGIQITAHRGGAKCVPENTLAALEYAKEQMADYVEIDVQETKDGEIVLLHDSNLQRTTGVDREIWNVDYEQIQRLDAGSHFSKKFSNQTIPTLEEALAVCKDRLSINIEVKYNGYNQNIIKKVVKIVENNDMIDQVIISSMNYRFLQQVKELNPEIKTSYVVCEIYGSTADFKYADCISVKYSCLSKEYVENAHKVGKQIHAWTVNDRRMMNRMKYFQVDNIITDLPSLGYEIVTNGEKEQNIGN